MIYRKVGPRNIDESISKWNVGGCEINQRWKREGQVLIELTLCLRIHNQIEYEKNESIKWDRSIFIEACENRGGKKTSQ